MLFPESTIYLKIIAIVGRIVITNYSSINQNKAVGICFDWLKSNRQSQYDRQLLMCLRL